MHCLAKQLSELTPNDKSIQQLDPSSTIPRATAGTPLYGDEEAERASGVTLPSLRVLQAAGAICSQKVAKEHGCYRQMWQEIDVLKASITAALGEQFAWNIRIVAAVMARVHPAIWESLIETIPAGSKDAHPEAPERRFVQACEHNWELHRLPVLDE